MLSYVHTNLLQLEKLADTPHLYHGSQESRELDEHPSTGRGAHLREFRFVACVLSANIALCLIPDVNNTEFYYLSSYTFIHRILEREGKVQCLSSTSNLQPIYTRNRIASCLTQVGKTVRALCLSRSGFLHYRRRFLRLATQLDFACYTLYYEHCTYLSCCVTQQDSLNY